MRSITSLTDTAWLPENTHIAWLLDSRRDQPTLDSLEGQGQAGRAGSAGRAGRAGPLPSTMHAALTWARTATHHRSHRGECRDDNQQPCSTNAALAARVTIGPGGQAIRCEAHLPAMLVDVQCDARPPTRRPYSWPSIAGPATQTCGWTSLWRRSLSQSGLPIRPCIIHA